MPPSVPRLLVSLPVDPGCLTSNPRHWDRTPPFPFQCCFLEEEWQSQNGQKPRNVFGIARHDRGQHAPQNLNAITGSNLLDIAMIPLPHKPWGYLISNSSSLESRKFGRDPEWLAPWKNRSSEHFLKLVSNLVTWTPSLRSIMMAHFPTYIQHHTWHGWVHPTHHSDRRAFSWHE